MATRDGRHWAVYNDSQHGRETRQLCTDLIALAGDGADRDAVDLGCGAGVETRALLRAGWRVHALDAAPGTRERVLAMTGRPDPTRLTIDVIDLRTLESLPAADLVYAGYSLPFIGPDDFGRVWQLIRAALRPGGWLGLNLFGDRDSWAGNPGEVFFDEAAARALLDGLDVVRFDRIDEDGASFSGPKHWHVFDVIAHA